MQIPVLNIETWVDYASKDKEEDVTEAMRALSKEWDRAFSHYGCAILIGHGIPLDLFDTLKRDAIGFFSQEDAIKMKFNHGKYGNPYGGYTPPGQEAVALSVVEEEEEDTDGRVRKGKTDPLENYVFTYPPDHMPSPISTAEKYYAAMERTLHVVNAISCDALGIADLRYFDSMYFPSRQCCIPSPSADSSIPMNQPPCLKCQHPGALKLSHYLQTTSGTRKDGEPEILYGTHTDYQGFTILRPDRNDWYDLHDPSCAERRVHLVSGGLEVYDRRSCTWLQVQIPKGMNALVINAGDLIQRQTNDRWHSPLHRVVGCRTRHISPAIDPIASVEASSIATQADVEEQEQEQEQAVVAIAAVQPPLPPVQVPSRFSVVFFTGPLPDCEITVLNNSSAMASDNRPPLYGPIRSGDHLEMKLNRTNAH